MGPRSKSGFTLIELMVVVIITSVLLTYAVPSISRTIADRRCATLVSEIVRMGRRARAAADNNQPAHLLVIRPSGGTNGQAQVALLRGTTTRCDRQNWQAADAACPPRARPAGQIEPCPEYLDANDSVWFSNPHELRLRSVPAGSEPALVALLEGSESSTTSICYEGTGATYWSTQALSPTMAFNDLNTVGGSFLFTVGLYNTSDARVTNVPRVISFPLGGTPRRVR